MRTVRNALPALLPLAIAALVAGCSRDAPPPRSAASPTFESSVPAAAQGGPGVSGSSDVAPDRGSAAMGGGPGASGSSYAGQEQDQDQAQQRDRASGAEAPASAGATQPRPQRVDRSTVEQGPERVDRSSIDETPTGAPAATGGQIDERRVCDALKQANLMVEDIPGGARILLTPKSVEGYEALRLNASKLVRQGNTATSGMPGEDCPLFQLTKKGAVVILTEGPHGLELRFTSAGDMEETVREGVRSFVNDAGGKDIDKDR